MKCPKCGHENDVDASFCENCGLNLKNSSRGMETTTKALIIVVIVVIGLLGVVGGYTYFSAQTPVNNSINQTIQNGTTIPYSSEYITFDKAKSIAVQNAAQSVSVSDPILMKDRNGLAVYVCYYYYNGKSVGGIIINAKTGDIIYKEQNLPSNNNQQSTTKVNNNKNSASSSNSNYDHWVTCPDCGGAGGWPVGEHGWKVCPKCSGSGGCWINDNAA